MLKSIKNNEQGVVFVTVLAIVLVAMVMAVTILSINVSQVTSTEAEVNRLKAEIFTDGALALAFVNGMANNQVIALQETMGSYTFDITMNVIDTDTSGAYETGWLNIIVNY